MALESGLRVGGVYVDVGLKFDQLDKDLSELSRRLERDARGLQVGVAASGGTGAGGGSIGGVGAGGLAAAATLVMAEFRRLGQMTTRGMDGVIDQLQRVARATATIAGDVVDSGKVAHDFRREERRQFHTAQAHRLAARAMGQSLGIDRAEGFSRLPADIRIAGGVGFDKMLKAGGNGATEAIAPVVGEILQTASKQAAQSVRDAGRTTKAGGYAMKPGRHTAAGASHAPDGSIPLLETIAPGRGRRGSVDVVGMAEVSWKALRTLGEAARRTEAALAAMGHGGALGLNRFAAGVRGVEIRINRLGESTRLIRTIAGGAFTAMTFPIRVALRHLNLFDDRVSTSTNALRILGRVGHGLTVPLTLPFRAASGVVSSFTSSLKHAMSMIQLLGPAMAVGFVARGVKGAADLDETMSKVNVTFGDSAARVTAMADDMANRFGVVRNQSLDAAAQIGNIAQASGLSQDASAAMGEQFTRLAADLASFQNISFDEALAKIRSGLVGEAEPLRPVGVLLSADAVEARAMAMGLADANGELSEGAKVQARAGLIIEQLANAHGDLERTSGSTANMMRRFAGNIQNAATAVGATLEPAFRQVLLLFQDLSTAGGGAGNVILSTLTSIGQGIVNTVRFLRQMVLNWDTARELIGTVFSQLAENLGAALSWMGQSISAFLDWFSANWRTIFSDAFNMVSVGVSNLVANFRDLASAIWTWLQDPLNNNFEFTLTPILEGFKAQTPTLELPSLELPNSYVERMGELIAQLTETALPGEHPGEFAMPKPAELIAAEDEAKQAKESRSRVGEMLGARELMSLLQGNVSDKQKDSKNLERIAAATEKVAQIGEKKRPAAAPVMG